jgi:hypothetical protein
MTNADTRFTGPAALHRPQAVVLKGDARAFPFIRLDGLDKT